MKSVLIAAKATCSGVLLAAVPELRICRMTSRPLTSLANGAEFDDRSEICYEIAPVTPSGAMTGATPGASSILSLSQILESGAWKRHA
jgi:hypothetical protein